MYRILEKGDPALKQGPYCFKRVGSLSNHTNTRIPLKSLFAGKRGDPRVNNALKYPETGKLLARGVLRPWIPLPTDRR